MEPLMSLEGYKLIHDKPEEARKMLTDFLNNRDKPNKMERFKLRMYSLVMYQLSSMQSGIQAWHSSDQFATNYKNDPEIYEKYLQWRDYDKTVIVLNGGSSTTFINSLEKLECEKVPYAAFYEEDLYHQAFAASFLVDERVWNKNDYPDMPEYYDFLRQFKYFDSEKCRLIKLGKFEEAVAIKNAEDELKAKAAPVFLTWEEQMGTRQNVFLREFLKKYDLQR